MKAAIYPKLIDQKESTLVLGSFESFHNGHFELIKEAKKFKKPISLMLIKNPEDIPGHSKTLYATIETRLNNAAGLGIAKAVVVEFNENIRLTDGHEFIKKIMKATAATRLIVGTDFACGVGRKYTSKKIANDFPTTIVNEYKINKKKLGTSVLKEMVQMGEVDLIKKVSPYPYIIRERVLSNNTFTIKNTIGPHSGIYIVDAIVNDIRFWGYVHVNMNKKCNLHLEEFNLTNTDYNAVISFHKLSRIIVSTKQDTVTVKDKERILNYFRA